MTAAATDGLDARVRLRLGTLALDVELRCRPSTTVAVLGPNGAGKSTLLRALAGLVPIDAGTVVLDGRVLDDPARDVLVRPEQRDVGIVFQDDLLFPHLDVTENVAFGLRSRGIARRTARRRAHDWLEEVGLAQVAHVRPDALSGGQARRVALARALATEPRMLLLDEPLTSLDVGARPAIRHLLAEHLAAASGVRVLVTHDPVDAALLADEVVVVEGGRVVQSGSLGSIAAQPRSRYVADLAGLNLLGGTVVGGHVVLASGVRLAATGLPAEQTPVLAVVHPRAVALHPSRPGGSPRNVWGATVAAIDPEGEHVRVRLAGPVPLVAEITAAAAAELQLEPGRELWSAVKATEISVFPA